MRRAGIGLELVSKRHTRTPLKLSSARHND